METLEASPRRAKRRKASKSPEQEDGGNISLLVAPTSATESSPPGAGGDELYVQDRSDAQEEDGVDRISSLPDAILGEVITLLPTKDAARTQILATRWRHLWQSAPLNLDAGDYAVSGSVRTMDDVSRILSAHLGPGRRFRFPAQHIWYIPGTRQHALHNIWNSPATVDAWLRSRALDNLQEIDCWTLYPWESEVTQPPPPPPPPASTFRFSSSLCIATLSQCHLCDDIAQALQFPRLKKLALQRVSISEDSLHSIIAASPVLECLLLQRSFGFRCVRINSASLTTIGVRFGYVSMSTMSHLEELIVDDAPCLKRIVYLRSSLGMRVSIISAPNLETLGCLDLYDRSSSLVLGSMIIELCNIKGLRVTNLAMSACTAKILSVSVLILSLDAVIDLMRCFPCLEKLYIKDRQAYPRRDNNLWRRKHRNLTKCLDIRLKTVVLDNSYRGIKSQVNFATFFVLNAKMLESMTFHCRNYNVTDTFVSAQHEALQLDKRASRCARFYFIGQCCYHNFMHIDHVHDASKTDPFECKETRDWCMHVDRFSSRCLTRTLVCC